MISNDLNWSVIDLLKSGFKAHQISCCPPTTASESLEQIQQLVPPIQASLPPPPPRSLLDLVYDPSRSELPPPSALIVSSLLHTAED